MQLFNVIEKKLPLKVIKLGGVMKLLKVIFLKSWVFSHDFVLRFWLIYFS